MSTVLERTRALLPQLRDSAEATERARRVLPETFDAMSRAGIFRMTAPKTFGGDEVDFQTQCDVLAEVARGCPSSSWAATILSAMSWLAGMYPDAAQAEIFGDGRSWATEDSYTATSYVVIFGGWHNRLSALARMNEHGDDRKTRSAPRVVPGRTYRLRIERRGATVSWWVDEQPMLSMQDRSPLRGSGHEYFAFNDWESEVWFDDLVVTPL